MTSRPPKPPAPPEPEARPDVPDPRFSIPVTQGNVTVKVSRPVLARPAVPRLPKRS